MAAHPVVSIDFRGHGRSAAIWTRDDPGLADHSADVLDVLEHLGISRCHFVGESFGGTLGLFMAAHRPRLFETLTIVSTGWLGELIGHTDEWDELLRQPDGARKWSERMTEASLDVESVDPAIVEWVDGMQCGMRPEVVASIAGQLRAVDLGADLPSISAPVLNLVAKGSPFVADEQNHRLRELVPSSEQIDHWHARHRVFISDAESCTDELQAFLLRHDSGVVGREGG